MNMKILVTGPVHLKMKKKLETIGEVDYREVSGKELEDVIGDYEIVVLRAETVVDAKMIEKAKKLKILAKYGVGLDHIDIKAAEKAGIKVLNAPTSSTTSVAEHAIMLTLATIRQLPTANKSVLNGEWNKNAILGMELEGKTVGLLGYGMIGRAIASRLRAFGCNIIFTDPNVFMNGKVQIDQLFEKSDILVITAPLNKSTYHLVDEEKLRKMQEGAFLINVSRGAVIDMDGLEISVARLGGVGLDVFEEEPPKIRPFMKQDNVILTPHVASNTTEARIDVARELFERIKREL